MPNETPNSSSEQTELEQLRQALAQREQELALALREKQELEELVLNGPLVAKAMETAKQPPAAGGSSSTPVDETPSAGSATVDVKELTKQVVDTAAKVAQQVTRDERWRAEQTAIARELFDKDPKFKLYLEEIKAISRQHPTLGVSEAYELAKKAYPNKQEPPAPAETRKRDVGRIRRADELEAGERFSGVPKVRNEAERKAAHEAAFSEAIEAGLKAAGLDNL